METADSIAPKAKKIHHLMRVKVRTNVWNDLSKVAQDMTKKTGEPTTVSDIVRAALSDWLTVYALVEKMASMEEPSALIKKAP